MWVNPKVTNPDRLAKGEEERSQMIGWDPKTEVAPSSRQRKKEKRKISCWTEFVADGTKAKNSG